MKIYIHYKTEDRPFGGGLQFLKAFKKPDNNNSHFQIADSVNSEYDILMINGAYKGPGLNLNLKEIKNIKKYGRNNIFSNFFGRALENSNKLNSLIDKYCYFDIFNDLLKLYKRKKRLIVHRVDGYRGRMYHYDKDRDNKIPLYKYPNDLIQSLGTRLSDFVIFQSKECLESSKLWGYSGRNYSIINNGVNQNLFYPDNDNIWDGNSKLKILSCSWSSNPQKGFKDIARFSELEGVDVNFVGNWCKDIDSKEVNLLPPLKQDKLANIYRQHHVLLFPSRNEPCSNTVIEALSTGLPIIYHNSGGTPELAKEYGVILSKNNFDKTLNQVKENYFNLRHKILENMNSFSIERAVADYACVFNKLINENIDSET